MDELDTRAHPLEQEKPSGEFEYMEVVVAVKRGDGITVFEGKSDQINVAYIDFWADDNVYHRLTEARSMTIQFPLGIIEGYQHA